MRKAWKSVHIQSCYSVTGQLSFIVKVEELMMVVNTVLWDSEAIFRDLRYEKFKNMWNLKWPVLRNNKYPLLAGSVILQGLLFLFVR